jgi:hypothetical protein
MPKKNITEKDKINDRIRPTIIEKLICIKIITYFILNYHNWKCFVMQCDLKSHFLMLILYITFLPSSTFSIATKN